MAVSAVAVPGARTWRGASTICSSVMVLLRWRVARASRLAVAPWGSTSVDSDAHMATWRAQMRRRGGVLRARTADSARGLVVVRIDYPTTLNPARTPYPAHPR